MFKQALKADPGIEYEALEYALIDRVSLTASKMTMREPFIAAVFTKLRRVFMPQGTAATDGTMVQFGVLWCSRLNDAELMFLCLHEAMHVVLMHSWRRGPRDPGKFNIAADALINLMLLRKGYTMPQGGVLEAWVTEQMSTEEVYAKLPDRPGNDSGASGNGQGGESGEQGDGSGEQGDGSGQGGESGEEESTGGKTGGGGWDGEGDLMDAPDEASAADMEATIVTAARMAKACGDGSALVARILNGGLEPKASWSDVLRHIMTAAARDDYTYRKVNKRFLGSGIYMPSLYSDGIGGLVVAIDTSGSMGQRELDQIATELHAIVEDTNPEWVEVVYCDSAIAHHERFQRGDALVLKAHGGGGTSFVPVFDYVQQMGEQIAALIYFTDLCGDVNSVTPPEYPVIWGVTYGHYSAVPFGEVVEVVV